MNYQQDVILSLVDGQNKSVSPENDYSRQQWEEMSNRERRDWADTALDDFALSENVDGDEWCKG